MHPDQFTLINSRDEAIFKRSIRELIYHAEVLDLFNIDHTHKVQIHVGGVYDNKEESMSRFIARYRKLTRKIKKRLVIENDERSYGVADCFAIHAQTGIPVVLDTLHHQIKNEGESVRDAFMMSSATWKKQDGLPLIDYSTQDKKKRPGSHAKTIDPGEFRSFLKEVRGLEFDVMFEIKDKETSALKAAAILKHYRKQKTAR